MASRTIRKGARALLMGSVLALGAVTAAPAHARDAALHDHALVLGEHLPHLMIHVMRLDSELGLSDAQRQGLRALALEVQPRMHASFEKAEHMERDIGQAVVEQGATTAVLAPKLDELQHLKRELTELQIDALLRMRGVLNEAQYRRALEDAGWHKPE
ncbi:MAG: Spy/CpxP family protein refolding chaperone [Pseudomonadota bacterium]